MAERQAEIKRTTRETDITVTVALDGEGTFTGQTGVGFLDHMLELLARHGLFDMSVQAAGDREVDDHHTVEDVGICLGQALLKALGDKRGIRRYGAATVPMDEALCTAAVDLGGRAAFVFNAKFPDQKVGTFDTALVKEFMQAFAANGAMNLHLNVPYGDNAHHIAEAIFKATARALDAATELDPRRSDVPSTKGSL